MSEPAGQCRPGLQPALTRGGQYQRFGEPPVGRTELALQVQAHADRPAGHRPPGRSRSLKLGRAESILQLGAGVSPREGRPERGQARLDRAETIRQRARTALAQPFSRRDGPRRLLLPGGPGEYPRFHQEQPDVTSEDLVRESPEPAQHGAVPAVVPVLAPGCFDQSGRRGVLTGFDRMIDRLFGGPVIAMPGVRATVQGRDDTGRTPSELPEQQLGEERVKTVPAALIVEPEAAREVARDVERDQEKIGARKLVKHHGRVLLLQHRIAQRPEQPAEDRRTQHQRLRRRVVSLQHLRLKEIVHIAARGGAEPGHEVMTVRVPAQRVPAQRVPAQRKGRQVEPGGQPLGPVDKNLDVLALQSEPEASIQELIGFPGREPQIAEPELDQLTASA